MLFALFLAAVNAYGTTFYVATDGKDSNAGTQSSPFLTLNRARDEIRKQPLPDGGVHRFYQVLPL